MLPRMALGDMFFRLERSHRRGSFGTELPSTWVPERLATRAFPPLVPTPLEPVAPAQPAKRKSGLGWLSGARQAKVPSFAELLEREAAGPRGRFLRSVTKELCLETPVGLFGDVPGLNFPTQVSSAAVLHSAVKGDAANLADKECVELTIASAKSILVALVDRAAALEEESERVAALKDITAFVLGVEEICDELAPDVEAEQMLYEGTLRYKKLEDLYRIYLETAVKAVQEQTTLLLSALMSSEAHVPEPGDIQERMEADQRQQQVLASVLGISENRVHKMLEVQLQAGLKDLPGL